MSQPWRKIEHLRKGKARIKRLANRIDDRLYHWEVEVFYINENYLSHVNLYIYDRHSDRMTRIAFNTKSMRYSKAEEMIYIQDIKKAIHQLEKAHHKEQAHYARQPEIEGEII